MKLMAISRIKLMTACETWWGRKGNVDEGVMRAHFSCSICTANKIRAWSRHVDTEPTHACTEGEGGFDSSSNDKPVLAD